MSFCWFFHVTSRLISLCLVNSSVHANRRGLIYFLLKGCLALYEPGEWLSFWRVTSKQFWFWALSWENLSSGFATRYDSNRTTQLQRLARVLLDLASKVIILSRQRTRKALISVGWSAPLLFAYGKRRFCHAVAHILWTLSDAAVCQTFSYGALDMMALQRLVFDYVVYEYGDNRLLSLYHFLHPWTFLLISCTPETRLFRYREFFFLAIIAIYWAIIRSILSRRMTKPTKWHVRPAKTQISLRIRPVWSESSLCAQWVAKDQRFFHADSEDSEQTGWMPRLTWVFAGRTCYYVCFVMLLTHFVLKQDLIEYLHLRHNN